MPEWNEIRKEYEAGGITLKELAEKHGVKDTTLRSRKNREKWGETQRNENATQQENVATQADETSWVDIESEYVTDIRRKPVTLKELAEKYNIAHKRVREYAAENDWTSKRDKHRTIVGQKTAEKTAERISTDLASVTARHFDLSTKLLSAIEEALQDDKQLYKYVEKIREGYGPGAFSETVEVAELESLNEGKLNTLVTSLEKLQKMQRQTIGALDPMEQHRIEMDKKKLGDGDEEFEDDGFMDALGATVSEVWADDDNEREEE